MMTKIKKAVEGLVNRELELASEQHGNQFHSKHEAYAVIKEEYEEAKEAVDYSERLLNRFWNCCCRKDNSMSMDDDINFMNEIRTMAILTACEAIQVAAMAEKTMRGYEVDE